MYDQRSRALNSATTPEGAKLVVYVMSRDQRVQDNHALLAAQHQAQQLELPLVVLFVLYPTTGVRAKQHYQFMLSGLEQVSQQLQQLGIPLIVRAADSQLSVLRELDEQQRLAAVYFDYSPLSRPSSERQQSAEQLQLPVKVVDTHNVVPVWQASDKQEYGARTIRPKLHKQLDDYLQAPPELDSQPEPKLSLQSLLTDEWLSQVQAETRSQLQIEHQPGEAAARRHLQQFIDQRLADYHQLRNDPADDHLSELSPYFHFGQLSPLRAVLEVELAAQANSQLRAGADSFIEEALVRRELSDNFCHYSPNGYRSLAACPDWAQRSLDEHRGDQRQQLYDFTQLEQAQTHDPAWNAAQRQLTASGKMHGYMRMYWAKKILEWTEDPDQALNWAIKLNDMYSLDGNDPNGYVGCLWSIGGLHDRGWAERQVFGKVRYMNLAGLKRKFDIDSYMASWS